MTADPLTAVLDQLAACREQLTQLDDREAAHFAAVGERLTELADLITTMGRTLADDTAALARLEALDRQVTDLAAPAQPDQDAGGKDGHRPSPAPPGGRSPPQNASQRSPSCGPGSTRCTGPATGTSPPPSAPAGRPHDLCLYGLDIASQLWSALYLQPARSTSLLSAQAEYQARILPALAAQLMTETTGCATRAGACRLHPEHAMTNPVLRQALAYADRGWPVFPCLPGQKIPATRHGYLDATTDPQRITAWFGRQGGWNLAIATGAPGPDVLDVDQHGPAGNGFSRLRPAPRRRAARRAPAATSAPPAAACTPTSPARPSATATCPPGTWTSGPQAATCWPRPRRSAAGPISASGPSTATASLDWQAVIRLLEPDALPAASHPPPARLRITRLVRWVAAQREGNRNAGLFWAANRALDADPAADLNELAAAARQAGLAEPEITRTLNSARRTSPRRP